MSKYAIPLAIFVVLLIFLAIGLGHDPHEVPSPLINKPAPAFQLPQLQEPAKSFSAADMRGKVWLLNVWATWCMPCREEHPLLVELSRSGAVPIYGLDYKDKREDALSLLSEMGNPYVLCASDADGRVAIDYGVYGVPETYVIDRAGVIRFKQVGPLTPEAIQNTVLPLVKDLSK
ncbi:MAG: cytochrome c biosis protein CcmG, thiol:disulfide interchange protein DsbE [Blastocatellia bacterium]|jgi:cytochrome c biogenesis protein CcmG/thiol:disulfide interchange protein DsbE|nr:cytochrome c biosis protein CcmG, thiol:disulfide interchange protein DsbE [Blastocatellia bacterium]